MAYHQFSTVYDDLMADAPYDEWVAFVIRQTKEYINKKTDISLLDIGCGTGSLTIKLAKQGFQTIGVDISEEMLAIAEQKAQQENVKIPFYKQNMVTLRGLPKVDCAVIFCDSLNYILQEKDVQQVFHNVYELIEDGGLLLFDIHSLYKINEVFIGNTFASNDNDISFIWKCFPGQYENSVEHDLSFFVKRGEMYQRFDEFHEQRTFAPSEYQHWLEKAGFSVLEIMSEDFSPYHDKTERVFFTCKK